MKTVALLVHPNGQIFAVAGLKKPREPMASGYINEQRENMNVYYKEKSDYEDAVKTAPSCNQDIALQVLNEQFPDRKSSGKIDHYDVKNIILSELLGKRRKHFIVGQTAKCVNVEPLPGNNVAPPLKEGEMYTILKIFVDHEGNQHLDVGLKSEYNYIDSYETEVNLPHGNKIHWCHPTRFE